MRRIYAVMSDGKIVTPKCVEMYKDTKKIRFQVNGVDYMYNPYWGYEELAVPLNIHTIVRVSNHFKAFRYRQWSYTDDVAYLYQIDPEEDEELNYFESTDFNAGVIYNKLERNVVEMIKNKNITASGCGVTLPKIQVMPGILLNDITEEAIINTTAKTAIKHIMAVYGKSFYVSFEKYEANKQYITFSFEVRRKEVYKEMTVAEIEKELGYKIKVVGDK